MKNIQSLTVSNFRSVRDPLTIPLAGKITTIVGPNNSGKSNLLRLLSIVFNNSPASLDASDFSDSQDQVVRCVASLNSSYIREQFHSASKLLAVLDRTELKRSDFEILMLVQRNSVQLQPADNFFDLVPQSYFESRDYLTDFSSSSSAQTNINRMIGNFDLTSVFSGTVYLPNVRFIATSGSSIPRFSNASVLGDTLSLNSVVQELQQIDRPYDNKVRAKEQKKAICEFLRFCLECKSVEIEVPANGATIFVAIDGHEQPISNLGTGIEQLLLIGLASFKFPEKLVLIDEPEIHFHPRSQKRMLQYLYAKSQAKFAIATHSAAVLDAVESSVVRLESGAGVCRGSVVLGSAELFQAVRDLGHSPSELVQANFVVWVEGPSDRIFINHWIRRMKPELREGVDYTFVFYGGRVLAQHDFSGEERDFLNALSVARQFAVVMDSDMKEVSETVNATKKRVCDQVNKLGGLVWITAGREIENYVPLTLLQLHEIDGVSSTAGQFDRVVTDSKKVNKVDYARRLVELEWGEEWPLDLNERVTDLVEAILKAR